MKQLLLLALVFAAVVSLTACGQRVRPADPDGKTIPSLAY